VTLLIGRRLSKMKNTNSKPFISKINGKNKSQFIPFFILRSGHKCPKKRLMANPLFQVFNVYGVFIELRSHFSCKNLSKNAGFTNAVFGPFFAFEQVLFATNFIEFISVLHANSSTQRATAY
jgi:hypothetical protein